jgi:hypothetical protein
MSDGTFLSGLGTIVMLLGALRTLPRFLNKSLPNPTGSLRGQLGSYTAMGIGGVLILLGLSAFVVQLLS